MLVQGSHSVVSSVSEARPGSGAVGAGIKGGISYGATDELGYNAVDPIVPIHDLHATILHLLGLDHEQLTYRSGGRDFRLTDVSGRVVTGILA